MRSGRCTTDGLDAADVLAAERAEIDVRAAHGGDDGYMGYVLRPSSR